MKKILMFLFLGMFLISFISAFDEELIQCLGGDSELCVTSIGDEELFFMGPLPSVPGVVPGAGGGLEPEIEEEIEEPLIKTLKEKLFVVCVIFLLLFTLLIILKDEEEEEKKS